MANPAEFHTTMYEFFYNGNLPMQKRDDEGKVVSQKLTPKKALNEFEEMMKRQQDPERVAKREAALKAKLEREEAARRAAEGSGD